MNPDPTRRRPLLAAGAWLLASDARAAARLDPTPAQSAGPFYPAEPPPEDDHDLTRVRGGNGIARGRITDLSGRPLDRDGRPIPATRIEIWQCDATGRYRHPLDRGDARDPNLQGFGHAVPTPTAATAFAPYGRCPIPAAHPTFASRRFPEGSGPSSPRLYVRGEPRNAGDFLFDRIPPELQGAQHGGVEGVKPGLLDRIHGDTLQQECRDGRDRPEVGRLGEYAVGGHLPR